MILRRCISMLGLLGWLPIKNAMAASRGPDGYFDQPADKQMALAIADGNVATVRSLLKSGQVQPLTVGRDATNWLVIAVAARQKAVLDALLELGALGDPKGKNAGHAMYAATLLSDLYWLKRLHAAGASLDNHGGGDLLLEVAMDTRNRATLDYYLDHGADVNGRSNAGGSVALAAAMVRRFDLANEFLDRGASPWIMDSLGVTLGFSAERAATKPNWMHGSPMDQHRLRLLQRLHAIGFPSPAPTAGEGRTLRDSGRWPPRHAAGTPP